MTTLGTMRARIARELQINQSTFQSEIDDAILSAVRFYNHHDFWFLETGVTSFVGTLTSAFPLATVLPDYAHIDAVVVRLGSRRLNMRYRTYQELLDLDIDDNYAGDPIYWSIHHEMLFVEPRLRQTRTFEITYSAQKNITLTASQSGVWMNEAEELIRLHAEADIAQNRMKDYQTGQLAMARLQGVLHNLEETTVRRKAYQRVRPRM